MTAAATSFERFLTDVFPRSILPYIGAILGPGELSGLSISMESSDYSLPELPDGPPGTTYVLRLDVRGEVFMLHLFDSHVDETMDQLSERFLQELQTWIAESTFGWGEQRGPR